MRVGIGYDSHRYAAGRKLVLGGVDIPHDRGLEGWSDADVVCHALTDAILGAAALGDIGRMFPSSDPRWRDANSLDLLARASMEALEQGHTFRQGDVTVICEQPRLEPYLDRMAEALARALVVGPTAISVKAKTNEGMGFVGRGEGVAAIAVAMLEERQVPGVE